MMGGMPVATRVGTNICSSFPVFALENYQPGVYYHTRHGSTEFLQPGTAAFVGGMYFAD